MASCKTWLALGTALLLGACGGAPRDRLTEGEGTPARGLRIASAAMAGGLPQAALNATQGVLNRDPANVAALLQQAEALTELRQTDAAAEAYRRVLAPDASPTREQARTARVGAGRADLAAGRGAEAQAAYASLIASNPDDPVGHNGMAIALDQQGKHGEAQAEYRRALKLADTAATRANLGLSLAMSGHPEDGLVFLRPLAASATPRIRHDLAFALELAGQRDEAKQVLAADMPRDQVAAALAGFDAFRPVSVASAPVSGSVVAQADARPTPAVRADATAGYPIQAEVPYAPIVQAVAARRPAVRARVRVAAALPIQAAAPDAAPPPAQPAPVATAASAAAVSVPGGAP